MQETVIPSLQADRHQATQNLLQQTFIICKKYMEIARITGERFNVFSVLHLERSEVGLHSKFLGEMLNPEGTHGQGSIFLKLFVSELNLDGFTSEQLEGATVVLEEDHGPIKEGYERGGRIDIVIKPSGAEKTIVIENKIDAEDQEKQLWRYYQEYNNSHLLYLTKHGDDPDPQSTHTLQKEQFRCISYEVDILNWLNLCLKEAVAHPALRETIHQYAMVIKKITNQTLNANMNRDLVTQILANPINTEAAEAIAKSWKDAQFEIIERLRTRLVDVAAQLRLKFQPELEGKMLGQRGTGFYFYKEGWKHCIHFEFDSDFERLLYGIAYVSNDNKYDAATAERIKSELNSRFGTQPAEGYWLWKRNLDQWEKTLWKDVLEQAPNYLRTEIEVFLKLLNEIRLI